MATQKKSLPQVTRDPASIPLSDLAGEDLAKLKRPRMGFEWHFESVVGLAAGSPTLRPRGFDEQQLRDDLLAFRALEAEEERAAKHLSRVKATRLARSASVWAAMMEIYARARAAARSDTELAKQIAEFQAFMKLGPRKKKAT